MILVDTSVWVDHLRASDRALSAALDAGRVLSHPLVIGELACGSLRNRGELLGLLGNLPSVAVATHLEALHFLEQLALFSRGIGFVDAHLLVSVTLASPARLWTRDRRLAVVAAELGVGYE